MIQKDKPTVIDKIRNEGKIAFGQEWITAIKDELDTCISNKNKIDKVKNYINSTKGNIEFNKELLKSIPSGIMLLSGNKDEIRKREQAEQIIDFDFHIIDELEKILSDLESNNNHPIGNVKIPKSLYVDQNIINQLKQLKNSNYDLIKLIRFCEELNDNFSRENYFSVAMIIRSIINHIPPIFELKTFKEVCGNYGGQSFKNNMNNLNNSLKNIADSFLHETIRNKEVLPNSNQVDFRQDLDVLLCEVIRKLDS